MKNKFGVKQKEELKKKKTKSHVLSMSATQFTNLSMSLSGIKILYIVNSAEVGSNTQ